jgi:response regulator RpfG family c-di-GMP phosphodiesterase
VRLAHCTGYDQARRLLQGKHGVAVVVLELGLDGAAAFALLEEMQQHSPSTVRMVLTASGVLADAVAAINRGRVWRYVARPCPLKELAGPLAAALRAHAADVQERKGARQRLLGGVKILVDIMELVTPEALDYSRRIRERVLATGRLLGVQPMSRLELAVTLSHVGCLALPGEIVTKMNTGQPLSPEEQQIFGMHPSIAANLLNNIDTLVPVARIIRHQSAPLHDGQPLESRIIKIALDVDRLENRGADAVKILESMRGKAKAYDQTVVDAMLRVTRKAEPVPVRKVGLAELREGMVMAEDLVNAEGVKLLLRGQRLSAASLARLAAFPKALGLREPILVLAPKGQDKGAARA